jgi:capsular polysaccharide transport system permease protein
VRVIHALIIRETRTRFGDSRLGYGWALIEPVLHIALLWVIFCDSQNSALIGQINLANLYWRGFRYFAP